MNATSKYLFDLNGYIIIRNVFTKHEISIANTVIDKKIKDDLVCERNQAIRNTTSKSPLAGNNSSGRMDLGRILEWGQDSNLFRSVLDHPKLR